MHSQEFRSLLLVAALVFGTANLNAQTYEHRLLPAAATNPLDPDPQPFDVLHYAPTVDFRMAPATEMSGKCEVILLWTEEMENPVFRFHLRALEIDSIDYRDEGSEASIRIAHETIGEPSSAEYHHQVVATGRPASAGDSAAFTIYYHGTMTYELGPIAAGGVSSDNNVLYAMGLGFVANYISTTQHWMPCYDHPSDKATYSGTFRIPGEMLVASNGLISEVVEEDDGSRSWTWNHIYPVGTHLLTFAVSDYTTIDLGTSELPMVVYTKRVDSAATHATFRRLPEMVAWYSEHFGAYPFEKVGYVNIPFPYGALEHQTMVSFPSLVSRRGESINRLGAHELAHHWFGDLVSPLDFRHTWLNESFANFSEPLWLEKDGGFAAYLSGINTELNTYLGSDVIREGVLPLYDYSRALPSTNFPATIYSKGAVVVGMLRYELGETKFFEAMRSYLERFAYSTATTADMQTVCEEVSGKDLEFFFDQWVRRPGWPIYEVRREDGPSSDQIRLHFTQVQQPEYGTYSGVSVDIGFVTPNGLVYRTVRIDSLEQEFTFTLDGGVANITFNRGPNLRALAQFSLLSSGVDDDKVTPGTIPYRLVRSGSDFQLQNLRSSPPRDTRIGMWSTDGTLVTTYRIDHFPHFLQTSEIPNGAYVLQIVDDSHIYSLPLILTR